MARHRGRVGGNGSNQHQSNSGNISTLAPDTGKTRDIAAAAAVGSRGRVGGDRQSQQAKQSGNISGMVSDTGDTRDIAAAVGVARARAKD